MDTKAIYGTAKIAAETTLLSPFAIYSHSIVFIHGTALIYWRKLFLPTVEARPSSRQNIRLLISKENSRDSNSVRFQRLSTTIGRFATGGGQPIDTDRLQKDRHKRIFHGGVSPQKLYNLSRFLD